MYLDHRVTIKIARILNMIDQSALLLDNSGKTLSQISLGSNIEASPAVFNNTLVVGTRGGLVCGIKLK